MLGHERKHKTNFTSTDFQCSKNKYMKSMLCLFIFLLFNRASALQESLTRADNLCLCKTQETDPLQKPLRFNFGKFNGQCIDSCRFRPAAILSNSQAKTIDVGNILHLGAFYKARIPLNKIARVEMGFEEFFPGIYHVFLQFHLQEGAESILLFVQSGAIKKPVPIRSLVISAEGVAPEGHSYSLIEGYFNQYLLITRLTSGEEMKRAITEKKHRLKVYSLEIKPEHAGQILRRGIEESDNLQAQNLYQLFSNNCSTTALRYIDAELGGSKVSRFQIEDALPILGPFGTVRSLINRKLIGSEDPLQFF